MASKNSPNVIISAAGWIMQFATLLIKGLLARGWDNERVHALVTDKGKADMERVIDALVNALAVPLTPALDLVTGICSFIVDFGKSFEEMVAAGRYDWSDPNFTPERFPIVGSGTVATDAKLFHFGRDMKSDAVERELAAAGYRSATLAELLAFGAAFPEVQRQFPVIALGSVSWVGGVRRVPALGWRGAERRLDLPWNVHDWLGLCRFLAVRLVAQATA